ncbi:UDP-N-acetylglucosamine 2-epimerase (non-hydrolyzing) [Carnobacterium divergens]|uniref:UDP-N-acetylglucosamine 2-epimerase (non-hydrolyzing) n=1 Tax=Carnobacterium divergens DSM 20623 TaxID=1449336 RepID=A0A0R2I4U6_CARDV|nr:UDP-N-acetylglucosamine 2-epimerase (non-hydrolyzing) [Carnobacterium divergens]ANZ99504.1 UDP-N-acetylglucosamine 2-epimerase [Carnobacterium divergens]KRN57461.1 UDP-N-acetylglucosamine 2-epimerase [Carnobacterium divergens DSM 20623]MDO0875215.1 UDP-N-acetylglucosamine 2-epimerase (non-hydrolyzing) [Carnobacterium divergens]TFI93731.1 UDP-N-acetylglucosamine 2-epimerase (non-hydrolyzing) [Carnobacterium divergens]TFJ44440.1 UDP-N-acetylglucosamine 2-epimerase (non-hydrolyzing) [Carnobact
MKKIKVMTIFGTRPEAIKMAPLVLELERQSDRFESIVVVTAQHRQMLDQVLSIFNIKPDYDLNVMKDRQTLAQITANVLIGLEDVMKEAKPDIVLVHGDTTTTFAAGISAFYNQIMVGHVEAGLRTWNKYSPFPEEMNRQVTDVLSDLYFAPTVESEENLVNENHPKDKIFITGNTAIDALNETVKEEYQHEVLAKIKEDNRLILMTMHRRENQGEPMERVFHAIRKVVDSHADVEVVYPVHLNPVVQEAASTILGNHERIHLIDPLDVIDFHNLAARSYMIMSDSGGVQEEAPSLGVPVLVLRDTTERPEGVKAGTLKLVGTETKDVLAAMTQLLDDPKAHQQMAEASNPYGDGKASERILEAIAYEFGVSTNAPAPFSVE